MEIHEVFRPGIFRNELIILMCEKQSIDMKMRGWTRKKANITRKKARLC